MTNTARTLALKLRARIKAAFLAGVVLLAPASALAQTVTTYATGAYAGSSMSFDSSGALFVSGFNAQDVYRVPPGGGEATVFVTRSSGIGEAVIGPDNSLYTVVEGGMVARYAPGSTTPDPTPYATGVTTYRFNSLVFDSAGRLYVIGIGSSDRNVYRAPIGGGAATVFGSLPDGAIAGAIAVGPGGEVFVSEQASRSVLKIAPSGGQSTIFATGVGVSGGLAVARNGDVYVNDYFNGLIRRVPASGGAGVVIATIADQPGGLTLRGDTLYVSAYDSGYVYQVALPSEPAPVPTMTEWAMILFAVMLAGGAALHLQRRRRFA